MVRYEVGGPGSPFSGRVGRCFRTANGYPIKAELHHAHPPGFLKILRDHLNNTTTYTYDALGRRTAVTDPRGAITRFSYDLLNRVTIVGDPLGRAVRFQYDPNSNLTKVIDPRGGEITYAYDPMDRLQTRTDPLLKPESFGYDLAGNLTSYTDRKNQQTTWDAYDGLNRPIVRFRNAAGAEVATLTYGYDAANRHETLTDSSVGPPITWGYDALDRMTSETTPQGTLTYGLDDAGRRTGMLVAGQPTVTYAWDEANRLRDITRGSLAAHYVYDDANRRTSLQLPNLVTIAYGYDAANRLTSLIYSYGATELGRLTYQYDPAGNRTVMGGSWARTLLPNAISTASYDAANRQLTLGAKTMTYDFNGNLTQISEGGQNTDLTWDVRDRLTNMTGPGLTASFAYDARDRRRTKTFNAQTTTFQYDAADQYGAPEIVRELIGAAEVNYLHGRATDEPLARIESAGTIHYLGDALGSPLALTDNGGAVTTSYTYAAFGQSQATGAASANAFQYTGRENDGTGLYYYRARYYHPGLSRFTAEDPIRFSGGNFNLYGYVMNNPARYRDPFGLYTGFEEFPRGWLPPYDWRPPAWHIDRNIRNRCPKKDPVCKTADEKERKWRRDWWPPYKYRASDGSECVYDEMKRLIPCAGTFNYGPDPFSWSHIRQDVIPHFWYGGGYACYDQSTAP